MTVAAPSAGPDSRAMFFFSRHRGSDDTGSFESRAANRCRTRCLAEGRALFGVVVTHRAFLKRMRLDWSTHWAGLSASSLCATAKPRHSSQVLPRERRREGLRYIETVQWAALKANAVRNSKSRKLVLLSVGHIWRREPTRRRVVSWRVGPSSSTRKTRAPFELWRCAAVLPTCGIAQIN